MLTAEQVRALYPAAAPEHQAAFTEHAPGLFKTGDIRDIRLRFMLAQLGHESSGLTRIFENMNYRAERLMKVWPKRFPTLAAAKPFAGNPEKLGSFVYANRLGNGPPESGDGFRYRGRGYIQITGRANYRDMGKIAGIPLEEQPELAAKPEHALAVACAFWSARKLNAICDTGDFSACTRAINGGLIGMEDRRAWLDKTTRVLAATVRPRALPAVETIVAVQAALQKRGFAGLGAVDGDAGPRTLAAIIEFHRRAGRDSLAIDADLLRELDIDDA